MEAYYSQQNWGQWGQQWDINAAGQMWPLQADQSMNPSGIMPTSLAPGVYTGPGSWAAQQTSQLPESNGADPLQTDPMTRNNLEVTTSPSVPSSSPEQGKKTAWTPTTASGSTMTPMTTGFDPSPHGGLSPDSIADAEGHAAEPRSLFSSDGGDLQGEKAGNQTTNQNGLSRLLDGPPGLC
jgi:hypothetical protein